jgi:hypothetical protein
MGAAGGMLRHPVNQYDYVKYVQPPMMRGTLICRSQWFGYLRIHKKMGIGSIPKRQNHNIAE